MSNSNFRKLQIQAVENYLKNSNCKPLKKEQPKEKKEIVNIELKQSEIILISEALETLYNKTIGGTKTSLGLIFSPSILTVFSSARPRSRIVLNFSQ